MTGYHWNHGCTMLQGTRKKINDLRSQKKIQLVQFRSIKEKKAKQKKTHKKKKKKPLLPSVARNGILW